MDQIRYWFVLPESCPQSLLWTFYLLSLACASSCHTSWISNPRAAFGPPGYVLRPAATFVNYLSIFVRLSIHPSIHPSVSVHQSVCVCVCIYIYIHTHIPPSIRLSTYICLSVCLSIYVGCDSDLLQAGRSGYRFPVRARFSALIQTGPGVHPSSYTMGTGLLCRGKGGRCVALTPTPV